jgi:hypothetical protein
MTDIQVTNYWVTYSIVTPQPGVGATMVEHIDIDGKPPTHEKLLEMLWKREIDAERILSAAPRKLSTD